MLNKGLGSKFARLFGGKTKAAAQTISRNRHKLSRKQISENALKVLYRLKKAGYSAYLVGGGVRDLLLKRRPKDFDVATDGHPEDLRQLFVNSRIIGRRFRLLHVFYPGEIIEVSTFRANAQDEKVIEAREEDAPLVIASDNTYGTIEEDAWRRDFTVNALYYNIADFSVVDFMGGMQDLKNRVIRMIGDPVQRYHEDPVRLLRAIRLAAKLGFTIHPKTEAPINELSGLLQHVPEARLFDEVLKLFFEGNAVSSYQYLKRYHYVEVLFPGLPATLKPSKKECYQKLIDLALAATDERFADNRSLNPGFLLSVFLWPLVLKQLEKDKDKFPYFYQSLHHAIDEVLQKQNVVLRIPKRFTAMMRSIWVMQYQLLARRGKRVYRTLHHRYFRAAFDFLSLRAVAGEPYQEEVNWWLAFQNGNHGQQKEMVFKLTKRK
ncbi:MAG: polynucleotide adenylyltransferase PcnB [Coxiellaceae bacterium]|nr:polynucleotide adenylyltransferase PcnB [Coxiellaceae bacterium]